MEMEPSRGLFIDLHVTHLVLAGLKIALDLLKLQRCSVLCRCQLQLELVVATILVCEPAVQVLHLHAAET